ncbi:MAG TPA: GAF domain-containing protein, partial [Geobacteraceae bacterium]|nr:GAF domain-containing protein [Geobacteraceae bacterium]
MQASLQPLTSLEKCDEKVSLLKDLTDIILGTDNISTIANMILDIVVGYTKAKKCSLMLLNDRRELSIVASRGIDLEVCRNFRSKIGEGIAGTILREIEPVLIEDIDDNERFRSMSHGIYRSKSFISCPIIGKKRMHGVLNASEHKDSCSFAEQELVLMQIIARQTAVALENAYLVADLKEKAAELEAVNRKLIETDILKTDFLTRISHELRTPLNSIKGSTYYLQNSDSLSPAEHKEFYSIISAETDKLITIIESQFDFLAYEDEMRSIKKSVVSLADILKELSSSPTLSQKLAQKGLSLELQIALGVSEIVADKIKTSQMFINLMEGFLPYLAENNTIRIEVSEGDLITVSIHFKTRLPAEIREAVFQSTHPLKKDSDKNCLKLYLARKTAENHGWDLNIEHQNDSSTVSIVIHKSKRQKIEAAIGKGVDLFLEFIAELMEVKTCSVMLQDEVTGELRIQSAKGLPEDIVKRTRIRPGDQISGWVALEGKPILIENIENDTRFSRRNTPQYNTKSLLSVPLKIDETILGVLNLNNKKTAEPFTPQDLSIATVLGTRISHLIDRLKHEENWEEGFQEFTESFNKLLAAGRKYHKKESLFRDLARKIMEKLDTCDEEKELALYIATIYDLGLVLMDEEVLHKQKLDSSEFATLKVHPFTTVELLKGIEFSPEVRMAILHHHEKFDGSGYPDGLAGEAIP